MNDQIKIDQTWDEESGTATIILVDHNKCFYGIAHCHEDDIDMKSEKTGMEIAFRRAKIQALKDRRDNLLKPTLQAYNTLYYSMKHSTRFNEKSYENLMLQRKIRTTTLDLETINDMIVMERKILSEYLTEKDKFYKKVRLNRKGKNN